MTEDQLRRWKNGELIQIAMPHLSASEREFIMTGYTQEDWDQMFGEDDGPDLGAGRAGQL